MAENNIKLSDYIQKNIVIPAYQRGYVWGKKDKNREKDSVTFLLEDLIQSYKVKKEKKFLQAITVYETTDEINIVDGQQRTVFFYENIHIFFMICNITYFWQLQIYLYYL